MAITLKEFISTGGGPPPAAVFTLAVAVGDVIVAQVNGLGNPASGTPDNTTVTVVDNVNAGAYTNIGFRWDAVNNLWISMHWKRCTSAGTPTVSASSVAGLAFGNLDVGTFTGYTGIATLDVAGTGTYIGTTSPLTGSPIASNFANELLLFNLLAPTGGIGISPTGGWTQCAASPRNYYCVEPTSGTNHNYSDTVTPAAWIAMNAGIYDAPGGSNPADGSSTSSTTASTGTAGSGMLAVSVGDQLDVVVFSHVVVGTTCTVADQLGNTYSQIDRFNDTSVNHNDFYRFKCTVTFPGTPVITATYGSTPASLSVFAGKLTGIYTVNPFTAGQIAHNRQATASGTDAQTSTATPILASQPSVASVWGFSEGETNAPTAGTGFTQIGLSLGGSFFAGACMTWETKQLATTGPATGTFTPVDTTHPAYTFIAIYNLLPPPVTPFTKTQFFVTDTVIQQ